MTDRAPCTTYQVIEIVGERCQCVNAPNRQKEHSQCIPFQRHGEIRGYYNRVCGVVVNMQRKRKYMGKDASLRSCRRLRPVQNDDVIMNFKGGKRHTSLN